jgi:hypothetical protein
MKSFSKVVKNGRNMPVTPTKSDSYIFHTHPEKWLKNVSDIFFKNRVTERPKAQLTAAFSTTSLTQHCLGQAWDKLGSSLGQGVERNIELP